MEEKIKRNIRFVFAYAQCKRTITAIYRGCGAKCNRLTYHVKLITREKI